MHAVPRPASGDIAGAAAYVHRIIEIGTPYTTKIAALPRPPAARTEIAAWLYHERRVEAFARTAAHALDVRDRTRAAAALNAMVAEGARADAVAVKLGANVCASS
jgi:hypothetical protein